AISSYHRNLKMPPSNNLSKFRYNITNACDSCKRLKIRCTKIKHLDQSTKCNECIKRNSECTYSVQPRRRNPIELNKDSEHKDDELFRGLSQEEIKLVTYSVQPKRRNPIELSKDSEHKDDELFRGLSQEEIKLVTNSFQKEQLSPILDILTSTSSLPCPYEKIAGHYCHMGCIVRYKYTR
ncbi:7934_t:CDS:1, partial [Racocetra persica]